MTAEEDRIRLGISTCLFGKNVRYDGGNRLDRFVTDTLGQYVELVPVCPEVECGLGIPREAMRLVGYPECPRLETIHTKKDLTDLMLKWAGIKVKALEKEDLCGFIFKCKSPSCGMERVKVHTEKGMPAKKGVGLFTAVFMEHFPLIPVEEDVRLHTPIFRENFLERIFTMKRWRHLLTHKKSIGNLVDFHTRNKLLLFSHSETHYRKMGKLVADGKNQSIETIYGQYEIMLTEALKLKATKRKNTNVLMHMMGYFKKQLSADEKQELLDVIDQYRLGDIPLIVPVTLIRHYVRKYGQSYLSQQTYLNPHPMDLRLRNHV